MRDTREMLLMAKGDTPPARHSVDDIIAAGRRRRRRRAFIARVGGSGVVAAAVATVGVLVSVNLTVGGNQAPDAALPLAVVSPSPTTPAPSPPFTFTFDGYKVGDYRVVAPDEVTLAYQKAAVLRDVRDARGKVTVDYAGTLTVYQPRMFDPARFETGLKLTVQGRDAYQTKVQQEKVEGWDVEGPIRFKREDPKPEMVVGDALAWQYAPDAWAVLEPELYVDANGFPAADQIRVAERFAVADGPVLAKLPFRTGYLPAGFTLQSISGQSMTAEHRGMTTLVYAKPQPPTAARDRTATSVVISVLWVDAPPPDAMKRKSRCNAGQHWCMTTLPGGEFYVAVEDPSKTLSDPELLKIVDSLAFADVKDASTWFPAA
jgi:hypothetical protein